MQLILSLEVNEKTENDAVLHCFAAADVRGRRLSFDGDSDSGPYVSSGLLCNFVAVYWPFCATYFTTKTLVCTLLCTFC